MQRARILLRQLFAFAALAAPALPAAAFTLLVIGDTGDCETGGAAKVSATLRAQPDWEKAWLVEVGDLAYPAATRERLAECHEPHFGMFAKRLAVPGNHDWRDDQGRGFFALFPEPVPRVAALDGRWQLWLLNSNLRGDAWQRQIAWLDDTLPQAANKCVIAVWHHPRWSSGRHGDNAFAAPLWDRLAGVATLTLHGHDHHYESLLPLGRTGEPMLGGTASFIAGHGGASLYSPGSTAKASKAVYGRWGFLRLELEGDQYRWRAYDVAGETLDAGDGRCISSGSPR